MQLITQPGSNALKAAFVRISRLPLPVNDIKMASGGDEYTDNYHDAYSDDPYVDSPYDDYQDNTPEEDG